MEDTISRKMAINAICEHGTELERRGITVLAVANYKQVTVDLLEALPSVQSERQKGEWIDYTEDGYVECPFCHSATNCDGNKDELHFCFSCGADMRGKQDE